MSDPVVPQRGRIVVRAEPGDIDEMEHVNNAVYLRWVQAVAVAHWREMAPPEMQAETLWVVLRHEIDYKAPAFAGDELVVETWVGEAKGLSFERHTEIRRSGSEGALLVRARTIWCPIEARTGRPQRVSPALRALFSAAATEA